MVDLPEPESPVSHTVAPLCPFSFSRSSRFTAPWCQTMFVAFCSAMRGGMINGLRGQGQARMPGLRARRVATWAGLRYTPPHDDGPHDAHLVGRSLPGGAQPERDR